MQSADKVTAFFTGERSLEVCIYENPIAYSQGLKIQKLLHQHVSSGELPDQLLLLEHSPVYTLGKRGDDSDFLVPRETLLSQGIEIEDIDRGGQITFHGPGQIVLYIICNLGERARSIRKFVHLLEQVVIDFLLDEYAIQADRDARNPGVWVGNEKIAAVGISIHDKTSMHGFALNISTDLRHFDSIIPCGIRDKGVCSVEKLIQGRDDAPQIAQSGFLTEHMVKIAELFAQGYGYTDVLVSRVH